MTSKVIKESFKKALVRNYAAQVSAAPKQQSYSLPHHQPNVTKLSNGAVVAAYETNSPTARIGIFAKGGSRYETSENLGVSHVLRTCAGTKTKQFSEFGLTRRTQQHGGSIVCETGREHISYEITTLKDAEIFSESFAMIVNMALTPKFRPWEIYDQKVRLHAELQSRSPTVQVLDLLHKAAFRNTGLGNSLFVPDYRFGKIQATELFKYVGETHTSSRMAFVGVGVPHNDLVKLAEKVEVDTKAGPSVPSLYGGGEIRVETGGNLAYVAVAGPGAKLGTDEAASFAVAQFLLSGQARHGKLASIIAGAGGSGTATAVNANYSDGGIFGFLLVEDAQKVGDVVKALVKGIRNWKISDVDVKNAKALTKASVLRISESNEEEMQEIGMQSLFTGGYILPTDVAASIDRVTAASVQSALINAWKAKPSVAALGAVHNVPYIDQL